MQQTLILEDDIQNDELQPGTSLLHGQYLIEEKLVSGGFGITYRALDSLERHVVIKECFPGAVCCRAGGKVQARSADQASQFSSIKRHFLREARRLAKLDHPNIVGVHQVFEENNSAYMALDYVEGDDLLTVLEDHPERLTPRVIRKLLRTALESVSYLHGLGILHRDISPDNFLLDRQGNLTLIDFGAAREHAGRENRALSALLAVKDGYSPHEFYLADLTQYASSDLYSLGATFYHLVTGDAPPQSQERLAAIAAHNPDPYHPLALGDWGYDKGFLEAIDKALAVLQEDRIQCAEAWLEILDAVPVAAPEPELELGTDLNRVISRLVQDTNFDLQPGKPTVAETRPRHVLSRQFPKSAEAEHPSQPVDIFGNPISDVDAWQKEQDRALKAARKAAQAAQAAREKKDTAQAAPRSVIARFMGRFAPRRGSTATAH